MNNLFLKIKLNTALIYLLFLCYPAEAGEKDFVPPGPASSYTLMKVIISLVVIFSIFYGALYFFKFFLLKKGLISNGKKLRVLDSRHPGANLSLYLVESQGKNLLIAANANHIALLQSTETGDEEKVVNEENKEIMPLYNFKNVLSKLSGGGNNYEEK